MFWILHFHCEVHSSRSDWCGKVKSQVHNQTTCKQAPSHLHGYLHEEKSSYRQAKQFEIRARIFVSIFYMRTEHHSYNWNTVPQKSRWLLAIPLCSKGICWKLRFCPCLLHSHSWDGAAASPTSPAGYSAHSFSWQISTFWGAQYHPALLTTKETSTASCTDYCLTCLCQTLNEAHIGSADLTVNLFWINPHAKGFRCQKLEELSRLFFFSLDHDSCTAICHLKQ